MSNNITLDVRAYPIDEPQGNTLAFASVAFKVDGEDLAAIRNIRVVDRPEKGLLVSMPQSKSEKDGKTQYHDIAFPMTKALRQKLAAAVIEETTVQANIDPSERGYPKPEKQENGGISMEGIKLDIKVFPLPDPQNTTLAFASVAFNVGGEDIMVIRGIRVVDSEEKGLFVSMPQSKNEKGGATEFHDVAFPLGSNLRKEVNRAVLAEFENPTVHEKRQGIGDRIAAGVERAAQQASSTPARSAAKKPPGLGD